MSHYTSDEIDARQLLLAAQEKIDRKRRELRELRAVTATNVTTSTREPGLSENQDFQENQDRQVLQESPRGDEPDCKEKRYAELFSQGEYSAIPEQEFLLLAWQQSEGRDWQNDGTSETWELCRFLCAHPKFASLSAAALVRKLRRLIELPEGHLETILSEITRVRFAKGQGPLDWAIGMAAQYPVTDPDDLRLDRYNRFLSIAGWLQVMRAGEPVYLPVEKLAKLLNVTPRQVSTWRALAKRQGLLTETAAYEFKKKATEFRFAVERFGVLRERGNL